MTKFKYGRGHMMLPWQNNEHKYLPYIRQPFNDRLAEPCWRAAGYTNEHFTGEMYDMRNPEPSWFSTLEFLKHFPWHDLSWSFYLMRPGVILPTHIDAFSRFKELHPDSRSDRHLVRAVVMLNDWQPGQHLDVGDFVLPAWQAGDYAWWTEPVPHTAANCGVDLRYTLQLTGYADEDFFKQ